MLQKNPFNWVISKINREKQEQKRKKRPLWFWVLIVFGGLFFLGSLTATSFFIYLIKDLPNINDLSKLNFSQSTIIYDRLGNELYTIHGEENRKVIALQQIPEVLINATLAIEDAQFFEHKGFDLSGILRSVWNNLLHPEEKAGGSTITQQFIKNTFLTREKTYIRKLKELILAVQLENKFSKEKIIEMYLNSIPYGSNAYGVESAAETFFGKEAVNLTLAESVVLAALPQAPSYYSPYGQNKYSDLNINIETLKGKKIQSETGLLTQFPDAVKRGLIGKTIYLNENQPIYLKGRTDFVLGRMLELGYLSEEEKQQAWDEIQTLTFQSLRASIKAPHFVMYVKEELEKKYGKEVVEQGGLRVYTTLDLRLQTLAEEVLKKQANLNQANYGAKNAAMISIEPKTGQIMTMVGSRDYWDTANDGNVNIVLRKRSPGSSFKPLVYAAAFLKGYAPATPLFDLETDFGNGYKPKNYDGAHHGLIPARKALGNSLNIPAVKMAFLAGLSNVYELAKSMGINFERGVDWYGGALALGAAEVRPLDLTGAYTVFANNGKKVPITPFLRVEDTEGNLLEEWSEPKAEQVLDAQVAYQINDVLSDQSARGLGWNRYLQLKGRVNGAKTGTSNKKIQEKYYPFDTWAFGYTPQLVTGVWVGNNDGSVLGLGADGLMCAGPIMREFMDQALQGIPEEKFEKPAGLKWIRVSVLSGLLPSKFMPSGLTRNEIFAEINTPNQYDNIVKSIKVDRLSGKLPNQYTPEGSIETRFVASFHSEMPNNPNWERPVQGWVKNNAAGFLAQLGINNVLLTAPKDYDDVHTAETVSQPEVEIVAPTAFGFVSPPNVGVVTRITSKLDLQKVEFFWDGVLLDTVTKSPWKGKLKLEQNLNIGSTHQIIVKVYDKVYNTASAQIEVKIAEDNEAPYTEIVFPKEGSVFEAGTALTVKTYSYDARSDIEKVLFYLNEQKVGEKRNYPYDLTLSLPKTEQTAVLKAVAFDKSANSAEDQIEILLKPSQETNNSFDGISILNPSSNKTISVNTSVPVQIGISAEILSQINQVDLIAQNMIDKKMSTIASVLNVAETMANGKFTTVWVPAKSGEYDLMIRTKNQDGTIKIQAKTRVNVVDDS